MKRFVLVFAGLLSLALAAPATAADYPVNIWYGGGNGYFGGDFGRISPYSSGLIPMPPYFAIHPPVYYSAPVPRAYGWSPFAYPEYVMTPEAKPPVKPAMFLNPFVDPPKPAVEKKIEHKSAAMPKIMLNPFVEQNRVEVVSVGR
jgi:hypothetical protein